ncbi:hypothetical protein MMC30_006002 [Trapelia coarctata]|nr:hypothetical protein [Trapelia coarctata]
MRFTVAAAAAALVAGVSANYSNATTVYTTEVVTAYTTYCPAPTSIVHGNQTYTVTEATTLTITNCPCTLTKPVLTSTIVACTSCSAPAVASSPSAGPTYANSSTAAATVASTNAAVPTITASSSPSSTPFQGTANKAFAASGAGLAGLLALAAYVL